MEEGSVRGAPPCSEGNPPFMTEHSVPEEWELLGDETDRPGPSSQTFTVGADDEGVRLDVFLSARLGITRSYAQRLIAEDRAAFSDGKKTKPGLRVRCGNTLLVHLPPPESLDLEPEEVPFTVLYEDQWLIVVDKPSGVVVHPAPGNWHGTLVHGLLHRYGELASLDDSLRPGIVHRLDAPTSGVLVVARDLRTMQDLQDQFRRREVEKRYLALVEGRLAPPGGVIDLPVGRNETNRLRMAVSAEGREARTEYRTLWQTGGLTFLECRIATGRTHQIRVHLSCLGHPIVGDELYGADKKRSRDLGRIFLHSWKLSFVHPMTGNAVAFTSALPEPLIRQLRDVLSTTRGGRGGSSGWCR